MSYLEELLPEFRNGAKIRLSTWSKGKFIIYRNGDIVTNGNYVYPLSMNETLSDQWEVCQEPIDWQYIIDNKCLCWFWDQYENCKVKGTLAELDNDNEYPFRIDLYNSHYRHCRPVRKDEVTFYEERKDEKQID